VAVRLGGALLALIAFACSVGCGSNSEANSASLCLGAKRMRADRRCRHYLRVKAVVHGRYLLHRDHNFANLLV
jgi:hypothetical protein